MAATDRSLLSGLRIVEIGESISAAVAGMVLADFGADVLMIEPPNGSRLREAPGVRDVVEGHAQPCAST